MESAIRAFNINDEARDYSVDGVDLWHGTGAERDQSIKVNGLKTLDGAVYASDDLLVASCFAMARSRFEKQDALIVGLKRGDGWMVDETMRASLRRSRDIPPEDVVSITRIKIGSKLYEKMREITELMAITIELVNP